MKSPRLLLYKLLLAKLSPVQLSGFVIANIVGAVIILFGVRAYRDVTATFQDPEGAIANNYLVITPGISGFAGNCFSEEQIAQLKAQPGIDSVGAFRTCSFKVNASLEDLGIPVSTAMFIESIPDYFLDVDLRAWHADVYESRQSYITEPSLFVPVILPRAYINVYNFGFAASRGTPQMDEALVKLNSFRLRCRGRGMDHYYTARVVGFTDRINTILVPEDFMIAAQEKYGSDDAAGVSRLIIKPDGQNDDALLEYITSKKYRFDGTGADSMKIVSLVKGIAFVVILLGVVVSLLAFFLLVVSIHLLIEKNKDKNATLIALGYTHAEVCRPYEETALALNLFSLLTALLATGSLYGMLEKVLLRYNPDFVGTGMGFITLVAAALMLIFSLLHILMIRKEVHE